MRIAHFIKYILNNEATLFVSKKFQKLISINKLSSSYTVFIGKQTNKNALKPCAIAALPKII
jgi:hypothetical protein